MFDSVLDCVYNTMLFNELISRYEDAEANVLVEFAIEEYASVFDDVQKDVVDAVKERIRQMGIYDFGEE